MNRTFTLCFLLYPIALPFGYVLVYTFYHYAVPDANSDLTNLANYKEFYLTKEVVTKKQIDIGNFSVQPGTWLIIGFMDWNADQNCVYSFILNGRSARGNATNGGGLINVSIVKSSAAITIPVAAYHSGTETMTARSRIYAIKLG